MADVAAGKDAAVLRVTPELLRREDSVLIGLRLQVSCVQCIACLLP